MAAISTPSQFTPVANAAFISLPAVTEQEYMRESGVWVAPDPNKRFEDAAACIGTVAHVKEGLHVVKEDLFNKKVLARIPIDLKAGDKVAVDYRVVTEGHRTESGFQHKNAFLHDEELVWVARPETLIAKWVPEHSTIDWIEANKCQPYEERFSPIPVNHFPAHWQALGEHVLLRKIKAPGYDTSLILPDIAHGILKGRAHHVSGLDLPEGVEVGFEQDYAATYNFGEGHEYWVINREYVWGVIETN